MKVIKGDFLVGVRSAVMDSISSAGHYSRSARLLTREWLRARVDADQA